jgi:hypothetical protein
MYSNRKMGGLGRWVAREMGGLESWVAREMGGLGSWVARELVAKLVARLLATTALWVRIQTSFKNTKWAT